MQIATIFMQIATLLLFNWHSFMQLLGLPVFYANNMETVVCYNGQLEL